MSRSVDRDQYRKRLSCFPYHKLQKIAKRHSIKANQKGDRLILALADYLSTTSPRSSVDDSLEDEEIPKTVSSDGSGENKENNSTFTAVSVSEAGTKLAAVECSQSPEKLGDVRRSSRRSGVENSINDALKTSGDGNVSKQLGSTPGSGIKDRFVEFVNGNRSRTGSAGRKSNVVSYIRQDAASPARKSPRLSSSQLIQAADHSSSSASSGGEQSLLNDSAEERKARIWAEIEHRVAESQKKRKAEDETGSAGKKRWFCEEYYGTQEQALTPAKTAEFEKRHKKDFEKMDSIQDVAEKRRQRHEELTTVASQRIQKLATPKKKTEIVAERREAHKAAASKTPRMGRIAKPVARKPEQVAPQGKFFSVGVEEPKSSLFEPRTPRSPMRMNFQFGAKSPSAFRFGASKLATTIRNSPKVLAAIGAPILASTGTKDETGTASSNRTFEYSPKKEVQVAPFGKADIAKKQLDLTLGQALKSAPPSSLVQRKARGKPPPAIPPAGPLRATRATMKQMNSSKDSKPAIAKVPQAAKSGHVTPQSIGRKNAKTRSAGKTDGGDNKDDSKQSSMSKFNLKQSLKRQLGYAPHRGPLKPFVDTTTMSTEKAKTLKIQEQARADMRTNAKTRRMEKKDALIMKKRGLV